MKLKLKKLMAEVLRRLIEYTSVVETQTITACGKSWTFRRMGNIVFIDAPNDIRTASAGFTTIGTLRASMRPGYYMQMQAGNIGGSDMRLIISEGGTVQFYTPSAISSAANCSFSGYSYIVGGVLRNPVISRLTAIFTSFLSGGDVDEAEAEKNADEAGSPPNTHYLTRIPRRHKNSKLGLLWVHSLKCAKRSHNYRVCGGVVYEHSGVLHTCLSGKHSIHSRYAKCNDNKLENTDYVYIPIAISERRWAA